MVARALASTSHPVLAQIVPARFCNLSCAYCNEYDKVSEPVPLDGDVAADRPPGAAGDGDDRDLGRRAADASGAGRHYPPDAAGRARLRG